MEDVILSLRNIVKTYPGVIALNDVSIDFIRGEIHGLVGENGAGKSTLIKVLAGAVAPDSGSFAIEGRPYDRITLRNAKSCGIEVVYQEFNLVPSLTVAENIFLGDFPGNRVTVDFARMKRRVWELFQELEINIDPSTVVETLSVAQMQMVEIAKSLSRDVKILVMDEPTAPLTPHETGILFRFINKLRGRGVTIIYISHRLGELFEITDRMTVMRDGKKIETRKTSEIDRAGLIRMMVGRDLSDAYPQRQYEPGKVALEARNVSGCGFEQISFSVREGEILGFAGLVGAGRTELMRGLFGADRLFGGEVLLFGRSVHIHSPEQAVSHRMGFLPEDRKRHSILIELSIKYNMTLPVLKSLSRFGIIFSAREQKILDEHKNALSIKTPSFNQLVGNLSGGNQQKVALSKWLASNSVILIFDEPTRGIDVGAKQEIYQLMNSLSKRGIAILMISSEMEEVIGMSDRIIVLHEGRMMGELKDRRMFSQEKIMQMASGAVTETGEM